MDFGSLLYGPIYDVLGTTAVIRCVYSDAFEITAIDKTSGVEVNEGGAIKTIRPAAVIRVSDLTLQGLERIDLEDAHIEINDKIWRVKATMPKPSPNGEGDGELYLFLIEDDE